MQTSGCVNAGSTTGARRPAHATTCRRRTRRAGLAALVLAVLAVFPAVVEAAWGPGAEVISVVGSELADGPSSAVQLSGDGRYVVFRTSSPLLLGRPANAAEYYSDGWIRKNLQSGESDLVATPERRLRSDGSLVAPGVATSVGGVSDDGRYVLLGSVAPLCCGITSSITPEVYLRDMTRPRSDSSGYELVSAQDGRIRAPAYGDRTRGSRPGAIGYALSDDGRTAVFVTATESSLPDLTSATTPPGQIFVRNLDTLATRLVTRDREDTSARGTPVELLENAPLPSPLLSGDGSAVVWTGTNAQRQARFLEGEPAGGQHLLWRDLTAAPQTPTRRVAGQADPDDPGCPPDALFVPSMTAVGPCYGALALADDLGVSQSPPRAAAISDDGRTVLFASNAPLRQYLDVNLQANYRADMRDGLSRKASVRPAWWEGGIEFAMAGDGRHAALVSRSARFTDLRSVGLFQSTDLRSPNLFAVDLAEKTVERMTTAPSGADFTLAEPNQGFGVPSLSDDGAVVAFAASDGNLFVGDVNGAADVQVIGRRVEQGSQREHRVPPPPPPPPPALVEPPLPRLPQLHAVFGRVQVDARGVATVRVRVPRDGTVLATATGRLLRERGRKRGPRVAVGRATRSPRRATTVRLRIAPGPAARRTLKRSARPLAVSLRVSFATSDGTSRSDQSYVLGGRAPARRPAAAAPRRRGRR